MEMTVPQIREKLQDPDFKKFESERRNCSIELIECVVGDLLNETDDLILRLHRSVWSLDRILTAYAKENRTRYEGRK